MKNKILKYIVITIFCIGVLYLLAGCSKKPSSEEFIENGIRLYEQEFNDDFTFVEQVRGGSGAWGEFGNAEEGRMEVIVTSKNYPNKEIKMSFLYNKNTKKYRMGSSNYNFIRYENQLYNDLKDIESIYQDSFIQISTLGMDNVNLDYEAYKNTIKNNLILTVYVAPGQYDKNESIDKIINILKERKIKVYEITVNYINDKNEYNNIQALQDKKNISLKHNTYNKITIKLDENYSISKMEEL